MENGPKESTEELDAQVLSEEEQREFDEAEARKFEYDGKMLRAREIYREIAASAENPIDFEELPQSFQEMLALVSKPQESRIDGQSAIRFKDATFVQVTPAGIVYKGVTYPFIPDISEEVNDAAIMSILEGSQTMEELESRFDRENNEWQAGIKPKLKKHIAGLERQERARKRQAVTSEFEQLYSGITSRSMCTREILKANPNLSETELKTIVDNIYEAQKVISADIRLSELATLDYAESEAKRPGGSSRNEAMRKREERLKKLGSIHVQLLSRLANLTGEEFDITSVKPLTAEKYKIVLHDLHRKIAALQLEQDYSITIEQGKKLIDTDYTTLAEREKEQLTVDEKKLTPEEVSEAHEGKKKIHRLILELADSLTLTDAGRHRNTTSMDGRTRITRNVAENAATGFRSSLIRLLADEFDSSTCQFPKEVWSKTYSREVYFNKMRKADAYVLPGEPDIEEEELTFEQAKARIDRIIELAQLDREKIEGLLAEIEREIRHYYGDLLPRYYDSRARMGSPKNRNLDDDEIYREKMKAIGDDDSIEQTVSDQVEEEMQKILETIAKKLGGDSAVTAYIFPTGIAIGFDESTDGTKTRNYKALAISPIAPIILDSLPEAYKSAWIEFWNSSLGNPRHKTLIQDVNACLDRIIKEKLQKDAEFASEDDREVQKLLANYDITQSGRVITPNGDFEHLADGSFSVALHEAIPKFNRFIESAETGYVPASTQGEGMTQEAKLKAIRETQEAMRKSAIAFILKGALPAQTYTDSPGSGKTLLVAKYSQNLAIMGEQEANRELLLEIGATLFDKHQDKIIPILRKINGGKVMSQRDVMRLTNTRVDGAQQRELITMRAMFVGTFIKLSRGEEVKDAQLAKFVSRVTDIEFPKREGVN